MTNAAVLLVEDNDINRDMLTRRLTRAGLTVIGAADGQTALDMMRSESPAVVLMDMTLPVLDGWGACEQAKAASLSSNQATVIRLPCVGTLPPSLIDFVSCVNPWPKSSSGLLSTLSMIGIWFL